MFGMCRQGLYMNKESVDARTSISTITTHLRDDDIFLHTGFGLILLPGGEE